MDDTQQSRASDAAATRKRRSSILKSQRPPRTPFSELEFNVATPTDTAKSRRVSFSRRTGVAEFITNEATTTWKNFYEEHNKSLESSGNDSGQNAPRQPIGHIGKRIFEQQFEEVEAVDFITSLDNLAGRNISMSMNNVNFTEQLASLECTGDDRKLCAPQNKFELSAFTDHQSKLFGDDLGIPMMGETSGKIDINFSAIQPVGVVTDDLDEIQKDLQRVQNNVVGPIAFRDGRDMSEYIEVELNTTHVAVRNEESDMSITEPITSPKVQNLSKICSVDKANLTKDWVNDKENKCTEVIDKNMKTLVYGINDENADMSITAAIPCEIVNTNKEPQKRKTIVFDDDLGNLSMTKPISTKLILSESAKSLKLNIEDLSNIANKSSIHNILTDENIHKKSSTLLYGRDDIKADMSITVAIPQISDNKKDSEKRKTIVFDDDLGNLSMTKPIPAKLLPIQYEIKRSNIADLPLMDKKDCIMPDVLEDDLETKARRRTVLFEKDDENADMSITAAIPQLPLMGKNDCIKPEVLEVDLETKARRRTVLYENDDKNANMSITVAIPQLHVLDNKKDEKRSTLVFKNNVNADMSFTEIVPEKMKNNLINELEKRNTIVYNDDMCNMSITKPIPAKMLAIHSEILHKPNVSDFMNLTQHNNYQDIINSSERNVFVYQATTTRSSPKLQTTELENKLNHIINNKNMDMSITNEINIAETPEVQIVEIEKVTLSTNKNTENENQTNKTEVGTCDNLDMSITTAVPQDILDNLIAAHKRKTIIFKEDSVDISITKPIPAKLISNTGSETEKSQMDNICLVVEKGDPSKIENIDKEKCIITEIENTKDSGADKDNEIANKSTTGPVFEKILENMSNLTTKEKSIAFDNDMRDISVTKSILNELLQVQSESVHNLHKDETIHLTQGKQLVDQELMAITKPDLLVCQVATTQSSTKLHGNGIEHGNTMSKEAVDSDKIGTSLYLIEEINTDSKEEKQQDISIQEIPKEFDVNATDNEEDSESKILFNSQTSKINEDAKKTLLNDLLDMSHASIESGIEDKNIMAEIKSGSPSKQNVNVQDKDVVNSDTDNTSERFYIIRDSEHEIPFKNTDINVPQKVPKLQQSQSIECKEHTNDDLQNKLTKMKETVKEHKNSSFKNRHYEKIMSSDLENLETGLDKSRTKDTSKHIKTIKEADDTQELLEMLSDFTDRRHTIDAKEEDENALPITIKGCIALENKSDTDESRRFSAISKRQSIVISREDLLNNISMAQAALQKSIEIEETDSIVEVTTSPNHRPKKTVRVSNEVVKTLHFEEDESGSDMSIRSGFKSSPLKKTAFGETSYMKESKAKVIPTYLKDVSDGIKALMHDLVKPMADVLPFEAAGLDKGVKRSPSTCSTHVQANLFTSSQIDIETGLHSNPESLHDFGKFSDETISQTHKKPISSSTFGHASEAETFKQTISPKRQATEHTDKVLVFDHHNPLNNVLLVPTGYSEVHKYNPIGSNETLSGSEQNQSVQCLMPDKPEFDVESVSVRYNQNHLHTNLTSGDRIPETHSFLSNTSKRSQSIDQSVDAKVNEVKDTEVNTIIAMKGNKELLEASSSLTLVDDALAKSTFDVDIDTRTTNSQAEDLEKQHTNPKSPLRVIYQIDAQGNITPGKMDSDQTSNDEEAHESIKETTKPKKRYYSPTKRNNNSSSQIEITPKPVSKMQKISDSPSAHNKKEDRLSLNSKSENEESSTDNQDRMEVDEKNKSPQKERKKHLKGSKKLGTTITVQQLLTEYNMIPEIDQKELNKQILEVINRSESSTAPTTVSPEDVHDINSPEIVSSFTSSNNHCDINTERVKESMSATATESDIASSEQGPKSVWQPMVETDLHSSECDSSVNVVAKIDMLPFMGSHECEWDTSGTDTWVFRLLYTKLRITIRLAHRHLNATRTRVRADTPVLAVTVHQSYPDNDKKNSVAMLCVRFAAEAMRYIVAKGCTRAGEVPDLLRRCAAVARVALRWGRAMHEARVHLAYSLTEDGVLAIKVANIPLRCVWEVRMKVEVVVEQAGELPWPRASGVHAVRVLADVAVPEKEIKRALANVPKGWGHVPTTIWKIFKYLKNKTRDDEAFGI